MKCALVTGGSRGIGRAIVTRYQKAGFEVFFPPRAELNRIRFCCGRVAGE